jgi:signal transduction histidine kinase
MSRSYEKSGIPFEVNSGSAIHVYRVLQEALNNAARHSGGQDAWVRLRYLAERLELEVEDHGKGFQHDLPRSGIGLVAMRERAELLHGRIEFTHPAQGGTRVRLTVPKEKVESHA